MADSTRELQLVISAKDEASKVLHNVDKQATSLGKSIKEGLQNNVVQLGAAFAGTTAFIGASIKAYDESVAVNNQLAAVLKSTKNAAGVTADEVRRLGAELQQASVFSDEQIISAQNLLLTFTKISKNVFPEATETVLNMSQALGQDLKSSSIQLGKALQDPIRGITALRRVGVSFTEEQQKQIETLVKSGELMKAQKMILAELATEFGGSALAKAQTFGGQMIILKNNLNDLQETLGKGFLDTLSSLGGGFGNLNEGLKSFNDFLKNNKDALTIVTGLVLGLALALGGLLVAALITMAGAASVVVFAVAGIAAALFTTAMIIRNHWEQISTFIIDTSNYIVATVSYIWNNLPFLIGMAMGMLYNTIVNWLVNTWAWISAEVSQWPTRFVKFIMGIPEGSKKVLSDLKNAFFNTLNNIWSTITSWKDNVVGAFNAVVKAVENAINAIQRGFKAGAGAKAGGGSFQHGGFIPGAFNQAVPAILHGGERVIPRTGTDVNQGGISGGITINFSGAVSMDSESRVQELADKIISILGRQNELAGKGVSI